MNTAELRDYVLGRVVVDAAGGCWQWQLSVDSDGFPRSSLRTCGHALATRASAAAWLCDPTGLDVVRTCSEARCVNPAHLRLDNRSQTCRRGWETRRARPRERKVRRQEAFDGASSGPYSAIPDSAAITLPAAEEAC